VWSWVLVAYTCNPSYSGGREQEDGDLKPSWANSSRDPISKMPITKKKKGAGGVAQGEGPEFKPQYQKKKKGGVEVKLVQEVLRTEGGCRGTWAT
jgi:hypothetical protein